MKNIIPTLIKWVLVVLFIQNIGGWNFVKETFESSAKNTPTLQQIQQVEKFTAEKIKLAEKKISQKRIYSPDEYFNDLLAIEAYATSLGLKGQWSNPRVIYLQNVIQKQVSEKRISNYQISEAANRYKEKIVDKLTNNHTIDPASAPELVKSLWRLYLQNIFLGIALLLVWFYQGKKTLIIRSPLSFLLTVVIYPVIIGISWYQGLRGVSRTVYGEAIARKFKYRVFDLLAEDEIAIIRQFVEGTMTKSNLKINLGQGRASKRSLATALLVVMIFVIVPQQITKGLDRHQEKTYIETVNKVCPDIKSDINQDDSSVAEPAETSFFEPSLTVSGLIPAEMVRKIIKMINKIIHIPLNSYYLFLTKNFNNFKKRNYREKPHFNTRIIQFANAGSEF